MPTNEDTGPGPFPHKGPLSPAEELQLEELAFFREGWPEGRASYDVALAELRRRLELAGAGRVHTSFPSSAAAKRVALELGSISWARVSQYEPPPPKVYPTSPEARPTPPEPDPTLPEPSPDVAQALEELGRTRFEILGDGMPAAEQGPDGTMRALIWGRAVIPRGWLLGAPARGVDFEVRIDGLPGAIMALLGAFDRGELLRRGTLQEIRWPAQLLPGTPVTPPKACAHLRLRAGMHDCLDCGAPEPAGGWPLKREGEGEVAIHGPQLTVTDVEELLDGTISVTVDEVPPGPRPRPARPLPPLAQQDELGYPSSPEASVIDDLLVQRHALEPLRRGIAREVRVGAKLHATLDLLSSSQDSTRFLGVKVVADPKLGPDEYRFVFDDPAPAPPAPAAAMLPLGHAFKPHPHWTARDECDRKIGGDEPGAQVRLCGRPAREHQ